MLSADAEWNKAKPDYGTLNKRFADAIAADPSRPEGYLNAGYAFEEQEKWTEARAAFEAGAIADPANTFIRDQRLTAYARLRDGKAYFDLAQGTFSDKPLNMDLPRANSKGNVTTANLLGKATVIEYWAYT
jgi:tetratricopeptide (TPR) repeat protein